MIDEFYESNERYINRGDSLVFIISDKHTNGYIRTYEKLVVLDDNKIIPTEQVVSNIEFHFNISFLKFDIPNLLRDQELPDYALAYINFSDIIKKEDNFYYLTLLIYYKFANDEMGVHYTGGIYTFEFEKCNSGLIYLKSKVYGDGQLTIADVPNGLMPSSSI